MIAPKYEFIVMSFITLFSSVNSFREILKKTLSVRDFLSLRTNVDKRNHRIVGKPYSQFGTTKALAKLHFVLRGKNVLQMEAAGGFSA
jgi:hypothetical protein